MIHFPAAYISSPEVVIVIIIIVIIIINYHVYAG